MIKAISISISRSDFTSQIFWSKLVELCFFHTQTAWLFIRNDIKTMVLPSIVFVLCTVYAYDLVSIGTLLWRLPAVLAWTLSNLLAFTINNQKSASSIQEDVLNKPWRPIPAGRLTARGAEVLAWISYPLAITSSLLLLGAVSESCLLSILGWLYNQLNFGGRTWLTRNILNGLGFTTFASGALSVTLQRPIPVQIVYWLTLLCLVISSTVHTQDMYDQAGDAAIQRSTVPLKFGDWTARYSIVIGIIFWSVVVPFYLATQWYGYLVVEVFGIWISGRTLTRKQVADDRFTFRIYNIWLMTLYILPAITRMLCEGNAAKQ